MNNMYDKIYNAIKKSVDSGDASGVNFLALKNGREIISCQYGYRDIENQKPMTRNTILRMYSSSKPVTAAAAICKALRGEAECFCKGSNNITIGVTL